MLNSTIGPRFFANNSNSKLFSQWSLIHSFTTWQSWHTRHNWFHEKVPVLCLLVQPVSQTRSWLFSLRVHSHTERSSSRYEEEDGGEGSMICVFFLMHDNNLSNKIIRHILLSAWRQQFTLQNLTEKHVFWVSIQNYFQLFSCNLYYLNSTMLLTSNQLGSCYSCYSFRWLSLWWSCRTVQPGREWHWPGAALEVEVPDKSHCCGWHGGVTSLQMGSWWTYFYSPGFWKFHFFSENWEKFLPASAFLCVFDRKVKNITRLIHTHANKVVYTTQYKCKINVCVIFTSQTFQIEY